MKYYEKKILTSFGIFKLLPSYVSRSITILTNLLLRVLFQKGIQRCIQIKQYCELYLKRQVVCFNRTPSTITWLPNVKEIMNSCIILTDISVSQDCGYIP